MYIHKCIHSIILIYSNIYYTSNNINVIIYLTILFIILILILVVIII